MGSPREPQGSAKRAQEHQVYPKRASKEPKRPPREPKRAPKEPKESPMKGRKWSSRVGVVRISEISEGPQLWVCFGRFCDPKTAPRRPKRAPGEPQESQESPKRAQESPKRGKKACWAHVGPH